MVERFLLEAVVAYVVWKFHENTTQENENKVFMKSVALNGFSLAGIGFIQGLGRVCARTVHLLLLMAVLNFVLRLLKSVIWKNEFQMFVPQENLFTCPSLRISTKS